eukprot:Gb_10495 [translate_table: standard]
MGPKKTSKRKSEDLKSIAESMLPQDEAPDFPRGGASLLSRSEVDEARAEADAEFEAEERQLKKRRNIKHSSALDAEVETLFQGGINGKLPKFASSLRFKSLSIGMKLWGVIAEVNSKDLVVSLPGGLRGVVKAEEASDVISEALSLNSRVSQDDKAKKNTLHEKETGISPLQDLFALGQLVPCIVCKLERIQEKGNTKDSKRIWLSLRLSLLHKGLTTDAIQEGTVMMSCVKSIEDHGYLLSFGLPSLSGFLPQGNYKDGSSESKLKKGQLVQGLVSSIDRVRGVILVKSDPTLVANSMIKDHKGLAVDLLVPGTMVNARVQAILQNGILLSFLTYFTGTVDIFQLQDPFPSSNWQDKFSENARLKARILYVDPTTKAVGLSLNPHLIRNKAPPLGVKVGDIFEDSRVVRVDRGSGVFLEIPSKPIPTPGYVNILDVSDEHIQKLEKKFQKGSRVRARILGFRYIEGVALATLKTSLLEQSVFNHSDIKPGMLVKAKVVEVKPFGAFVQLSNGLKALCPLEHTSEFDVAKPSKKFKVGANLRFRILGCKSKKITVTHKKTLVTSKLRTLANYEDAVEGLVSHGWITGIVHYGCFVKFYNGVKGLAQRSELGIDPGTEADSVFRVGQVVRCKVLRAIPASRRLDLSFITSSHRQLVGDGISLDVKIGNIVSGVVGNLTSTAVILDVPVDKGSLKGTIFNEHLSDNPGHFQQMKSLLKPGYKFDKLLVLDIINQNLILSAKFSLVEFAKLIPSDIVQLKLQSVIQGYICNIIEKGCFVHFLGHLKGFAPKQRVLDGLNGDLSQCLYVGQSVRSQILNVDDKTGRISLSLEQSACFSTDASLVQGYFLDEDKIAKLHASESGGSDINWAENFNIGSCIDGEIQEIKEYGIIVNLKEHKDIVGFITHYQLGGVSVEIGTVVQALILDVVKSDGIVDLSLRPELVQHSKEGESKRRPLTKRRRKSELHSNLELHQKVDAVVELVKDDYLVLSLPEHGNAIAFASTHDYNMRMDSHKHYTTGQKVSATVEALPSAVTIGRLLLLLSYCSDTRAVSDSKQIEENSDYEVGTFVKAEIFAINPLEMWLKFGKGLLGRVHVTEVNDEYKEGSPFEHYKLGQTLMAKIIEEPSISGKSASELVWDLSLRPSVLLGNGEANKGCLHTLPNFSAGDTVTAYVEKVESDWVRLLVSRHTKGHLFILDSSSEPIELQSFEKRFIVGHAIDCRILSLDKKKGILDLTLRFGKEKCRNGIQEGDIVGGRIARIMPGVGGLTVQIGPHTYGRVHFTELGDIFTENPLYGYKRGQFVKCKVLKVNPAANSNVQIDLSLRRSRGGSGTLEEKAIKKPQLDFLRSSVERIHELKPNLEVQGYVKSVSSKGCFVMLSRHIDARVLISNLSDTYIEDPQEKFPVGKLVKGRYVIHCARTSFMVLIGVRNVLKLTFFSGSRVLSPSPGGLR